MIDYDFFESPDYDESGARRLHIRPVNTRRHTTENVCEYVEKVCTLTRADIKAVLSAVSDYIADRLATGGTVQLDDIGTISLSLSATIDNSGEKPTVVGDITSNIRFRADMRLKRRLADARYHCRRTLTPTAREKRREKRDAVLQRLLNEKGFVTVFDYYMAAGISYSGASRYLLGKAAEGTIKNTGRANRPIYVAAPKDTDDAAKESTADGGNL